METVVIEVTGMRCGGCERTVREAVAVLPGVEAVVPEHIADLVEVRYDPELTTLEPVREAIRAAGFSPLP